MTSAWTNDAQVEAVEAELGRVRDAFDALVKEVGRAVIGQEEVVRDLLIALLSRGHCLLIGVPGLAKTLIVRSLARALDWEYRRIQFTPDLMPADIIGVEILETDATTHERRLRFVPGPVFANVVLADEINRTPPRTQAALLEAMQEGAVTVSGKTLKIAPPFFVVATQNPIEQEGTFPLPEAQLDRFMFSIDVTYPAREEEERIAVNTTSGAEPELTIVLTRQELLRVQEVVRAAPVSPHVARYAVGLARASRPADPDATAMVRRYVEWGAGPRASQYLLLGAKARAILSGRPSPSVGDVRAVAPRVLLHRVLCNYTAAADGVGPADVVSDLLTHVREPTHA